jgi:hypothetical protein
MATLHIKNGIDFDADIFIIPNSASMIKDFFNPEDQLKKMNAVCGVNGITFDPENDFIIETWYVADQLCCENIADHDIYFNDEDGNECTLISDPGRFLPAKLFESHKEGETITVSLPMGLIKNYHEEHDVVVKVHMTLNQGEYRYRRFGDFENVLDDVIAKRKSHYID